MSHRIEERLKRRQTPEEADALLALIQLANLAGARSHGIEWGTETGPPNLARWYGYAVFTGERLTTPDNHDGPASAAHALSLLLMARMRCLHCDRPLSNEPAEGSCHWTQEDGRWVHPCHHPKGADPASSNLPHTPAQEGTTP